MSDQNSSQSDDSNLQTEGTPSSGAGLFSAFEVEEMAASDELQERRRRTKMALQESTHMDEAGEEEGEEVGGLRGLLKEADVSPKQLGFCCLGLVFLVVCGLGIFYKGSALKTWVSHAVESVVQMEWFKGASEGTTPVETPATPGDSEGPVAPAQPTTVPEGVIVVPSRTGAADAVDFTVSVGIQLGGVLPSEAVEAETGELVGTPEVSGEFQTQIRDLQRILEAASTDVNELLNKSTDRRKALSDYVTELQSLEDLGNQNVAALTATQNELSHAFDAADAKQAEQEGLFFDHLKNLDPFASTSNLDSFVGYGQEVVRLKAEYRARQQLVDYYTIVLKPIDTKIHDIQVNEEALVKGIHVVEVEGSDLDLILKDPGL